MIQSFDHHLSSQNHDLKKVNELKLPDVTEEQSFDENISLPTVEEIEDRWIKLRFFNKVWLPAKDSFEPHINAQSPGIETKNPLDDENLSTPKAPDEVEPVFSTIEDTDAFNDWYCEKISVNKPTPKVVAQEAVTTKFLFDDANLQLTSPAQSVVDKLDDFQGKQDMNIIPPVWLVNMTLVIVLEMLKLTSVHPNFLKLLKHHHRPLGHTPNLPLSPLCPMHGGHTSGSHTSVSAPSPRPQRKPVRSWNTGWGLLERWSFKKSENWSSGIKSELCNASLHFGE